MVCFSGVQRVARTPNVPSHRGSSAFPKVLHQARGINMILLIKWFSYAGIIYFTCWLLPGIKVANFRIAVIVAAVLAIINVVVKPILILFTLPITILTLGLFLLVINALMLMLASRLVDGFVIANFWWAVLGSLIISCLYNLIF